MAYVLEDRALGSHNDLRNLQNAVAMDILLEAGGETKYDVAAVLALLRGRLDSLAEQIDVDPPLVNRIGVFLNSIAA